MTCRRRSRNLDSPSLGMITGRRTSPRPGRHASDHHGAEAVFPGKLPPPLRSWGQQLRPLVGEGVVTRDFEGPESRVAARAAVAACGDVRGDAEGLVEHRQPAVGAERVEGGQGQGVPFEGPLSQVLVEPSILRGRRQALLQSPATQQGPLHPQRRSFSTVLLGPGVGRVQAPVRPEVVRHRRVPNEADVHPLAVGVHVVEGLRVGGGERDPDAGGHVLLREPKELQPLIQKDPHRQTALAALIKSRLKLDLMHKQFETLAA